MQKLTLPKPTTPPSANELRVVSINRNQNDPSVSIGRHFTKTISGEPGVNAPARKYYPRSYSADGPGGNYKGL